jgi:hypothetical protein
VEHYVGFEVLTAVVMKSTIFWDITPCSYVTTGIISEKVVLFVCEIQRGPKKSTHSLSAAITPDTLTAVFAQQFGGIDAV